ncbi:MAG: hypothetical protein EA382_12105 [Spirochaetaceae bacterium]|nr:MAG: hypothetical protein EA382_12105 [Spirochaetaceae bacterium]
MSLKNSRAARLISLLIPVLVTSCFLLPQEEEVLAPPLAEPPQIVYRTTEVTRATLESSIRAFGTFISAGQSDLSFERRGGRLRRVYIAPGETVAAGQLVADLHSDSLEIEVAQAELNVERAQIALERARTQVGDRFAVEFARADRDLALLRLNEVADDLALQRDLAVVTGEQRDAIRALERRYAEQEIAVRKATLSLEQLQERESAASVRLAEIDLRSAQMHLQTLLGHLEATRLYAPIPGVITWVSRQAQEGENVQAFQPLMRIADPTNLLFQYQGRDANRFEVGMEAVVEVASVEYTGRVVLTERSVPFDQREEFRETVHIAVPGIAGDVRLGQTGTARMVLARREDVLVVPARAVQRFSTRRFVNVLADGVRVERDVEVGLETPTDVEIVGGLEEGEQIVLR